MGTTDKQLISDLGIGSIPNPQPLLDEYYETLKLRVSMAVEDHLTDEQLEKFEKILDSAGDEAATEWLRETLPNFDELIKHEEVSLKNSIRETQASLRKAAGFTE